MVSLFVVVYKWDLGYLHLGSQDLGILVCGNFHLLMLYCVLWALGFWAFGLWVFENDFLDIWDLGMFDFGHRTLHKTFFLSSACGQHPPPRNPEL